MYSLTPSYDLTSIGQKIARRDIAIGHVFKYTDGQFTYGHLGKHEKHGTQLYFSLKLLNKDNEITLATTPAHSDKMNNTVFIKGYFHFELSMYNTPRLSNIRDLVPYENRTIKDVVTIRGFTRHPDNSAILFLLLGYTASRSHMYVLRLTGDLNEIAHIVEVPVTSVVAVRGKASLNWTEGT